MEIARISENLLVLKPTRTERVPVLGILMVGVSFSLLGYTHYRTSVDYAFNGREMGTDWLAPVAVGLAALAIGLYLTGQKVEIVFQRQSAACDYHLSWFGCWPRKRAFSPAVIICSEQPGEYGNYYRMLIYRRRDLLDGRFALLKARLKGRSVHLGDFKSKQAMDMLLKEISAFTGKQVRYHKQWQRDDQA